MERLERIASRVAQVVTSSEQSPEEMLESASLFAELAHEFEAFRQRNPGEGAPDTEGHKRELAPEPETTSTVA